MNKPVTYALTVLLAAAPMTGLAQASSPQATPSPQPSEALPPGPNPNSQYRLGPDSLPQEGVPKGEIRGPYTAAFTVAWERPDDFRKVLSNVGSFVDLRGGYVYPERVLASERKPIRIFLCDGRNDHRGTLRGTYDEKMDWFLQNVRLMKALTQKGYDVNYTWGMNLHGQKFGGAIMPDMMRWLWRDAPVSTDPNDMVERGFKQPVSKTK